MFDPNPPKSRKAFALQFRYAERARKRVLAVLAANRGPAGVEYKDLFCEAMFFPLVTPNDLVKWLNELKPNIQIEFAGVPSKKKPKPSEDYRVVVINSNALK